jgi:hypothetical protein
VTKKRRRLSDELKAGFKALAADREGIIDLHKETRIAFSPEDAAEISSLFRALTDKIPLRPIQTEAGYDHAVRALNALLDAGGADELHELAGLAAVLGGLIAEVRK